LHVGFIGASNRYSPCRFSLATDRGASAVSLEAPRGELIRPSTGSLGDAAFAELQGRLSGMLTAERRFTSDQLRRVQEMSAEEMATLLRRLANVATSVQPEHDGGGDGGGTGGLALVRAAAVTLVSAESVGTSGGASTGSGGRGLDVAEQHVVLTMNRERLVVASSDMVFGMGLLDEICASV